MHGQLLGDSQRVADGQRSRIASNLLMDPSHINMNLKADSTERNATGAHAANVAPAAARPAAPARPKLRLSVSMEDGATVHVPSITFELVRRLERADSLREAANGFGFSYRYAWGLIRSAEQELGAALVETRRGHGTRLTAYGSMLAAALAEIELQLTPELDAATQALSAALALRQGPVQATAPAAASPVAAGARRRGHRDTALTGAWKRAASATVRKNKGRSRAR